VKVVKRFLIAIMALLAMTGVAEAKKKRTPPPAAPALAYAATPAVQPENVLVLQISTGGYVRIQLRPDIAPAHIERIKALTRAQFYDGVLFHRVIEGFMAQTGDPKGTGEGGSPLPDLKAEFNGLPHMRGTVSMARTDASDSANSQFFICFQPVVKLDGKYTVFGRVLDGMQYVDLIERGEPPANPARIVKAFIEADGPNAPRQALAVPTAPATRLEAAATIADDAVTAPAAVEPAPKPKKKKKFLGL
jgi:cyclophilin family peptidyl-prolyl cis-trans isomerase